MTRKWYDQKSAVCEGCFFYELPEQPWRPIGGCRKCGYIFHADQGLAPDCDERRTESEFRLEEMEKRRRAAAESQAAGTKTGGRRKKS